MTNFHCQSPNGLKHLVWLGKKLGHSFYYWLVCPVSLIIEDLCNDMSIKKDQLPSQSDACLALFNSPVSQASQEDHLVHGFQSEYFQQNVCLDRASNYLDPCRSSSVNLQDRERKRANAWYTRNALLSVMPELMFRRVPVGSLMPMQGESTAKGKFNHWKVRHKKPELPESSCPTAYANALPIGSCDASPISSCLIVFAAKRSDVSACTRSDHPSDSLYVLPNDSCLTTSNRSVHSFASRPD
ncbi:hypothetical protein LR48_Vigan07g161800 [Vigna angularis]|uniref:Uncharacterized protein n=1 Tax=Phaseolus angularis TaxID=3914 RepID=A0A0L9UZE1_PHAAN|nr:hypothetical protein LR48_Vigan07g161800 [Vigna angularis]